MKEDTKGDQIQKSSGWNSSCLGVESGRGEIFEARKGSSCLWMGNKGSVEGKDFKGIFCVRHTHTNIFCPASLMKDKGKFGYVFRCFYFPVGLSSRDWAIEELNHIWVTLPNGQRDKGENRTLTSFLFLMRMRTSSLVKQRYTVLMIHSYLTLSQLCTKMKESDCLYKNLFFS